MYSTRVSFVRGTYEQFYTANIVIPKGTIVVVFNLPWYKSWFGLKPTRLMYGDGKTEFRKLKFL